MSDAGFMYDRNKVIIMKINNKEPAEIEAQTAAFLVSDQVPGELSYAGMASAAKHLIAFADDEDKINEIITETSPYAKAVDAKQVKDAYVGFLQQQTDFSKQERLQLSPYLAKYEVFRKSIAVMQKSKDMMLGKGAFSKVYSLPFYDDFYAVRIPGAEQGPAIDQIHKHLRACMKVADLPHVEKLVAASYVDGITVSEIAAGKELSKLSLDEFADITTDQIAELRDTLQAAFERGVGFDSMGRNLFYDPTEGFTAIDLSVIESDFQREDFKRVNQNIRKAISRGFDEATEPLHGPYSGLISRSSLNLVRKVREVL